MSTPSEPAAPPAVITPDAYQAPMPTTSTVRKRTNLPIQAYRFAAVSLKMTRMILRSHG
ncbi:MAG: hypothetical protein U0R68_15880 [Candidatus Nanopelagicales bacterium]